MTAKNSHVTPYPRFLSPLQCVNSPLRSIPPAVSPCRRRAPLCLRRRKGASTLPPLPADPQAPPLAEVGRAPARQGGSADQCSRSTSVVPLADCHAGSAGRDGMTAAPQPHHPLSLFIFYFYFYFCYCSPSTEWPAYPRWHAQRPILPSERARSPTEPPSGNAMYTSIVFSPAGDTPAVLCREAAWHACAPRT